MAGVIQLGGHHPLHKKAASLIPDQGTLPGFGLDPQQGPAGGSQTSNLTWISLSPPPFLSL